jgi:multicomponent Na+:H+ antiporter subunit C
VATLLAILIGCLYAAAIFTMLGRSLFRLILGLVLLGHGANLLIFTAAGLTRAQPPIVPSSGDPATLASADPLPQALILTAIVIGFAVLAFALVLFHRAYQVIGTDDSDELRVGDS